MMNVMCWNCRGLGSPAAIRALKREIVLENPKLIFLDKTKLKQWEMDNVRKKLNMANMVVVDCLGEGRGRRGGLALLWEEKVDISIRSMSQNFSDVIVQMHRGRRWRFSGVYGFPEEEEKHKTVVMLKDMAQYSEEPWLCGGDFNLLLESNEKQGGMGSILERQKCLEML